MGEIMARQSFLTRNDKTRLNYATGLSQCLDTCQCRNCRKKRALEEQAQRKGMKPYDNTNSSI